MNMEYKHLKLWLSFDVFVPTSAHPLLFVDKWFVQIYLKVSYGDFNQHKRGNFWINIRFRVNGQKN